MDYKKMSETLDSYLRLQTYPVAVRLLDSNAEKPENYKSPKEMGIKIPVCQGVSLSRRYGWKLAMGEKDMACPIGAVTLGFVPPKKKFLDGSLEVPQWAATQEARAKLAQNLPKLEHGKYRFLLSAPLSDVDFEPHAVIIYGNPAQIMRLVQSAVYETGDPVLSYGTGAYACGTYISKTVLTDQCQFVLSGAGDRIFALTQDHELCFSMPFSKVDAVLEGLDKTSRGGMRYPTTPYLRFEPILPKPYRDLMVHLESDE